MLFVNPEGMGGKKESTKRENFNYLGGEKCRKKKEALMHDRKDTNDVSHTSKQRDPRFLLCEFQAHPRLLPLPDPSWPHRWTFEKQSLESVPSNGFIKGVIILQRGGAVNRRSNDVFHYPTLTKLFIQGLTEYLQLSFFSPFSSPTFTKHRQSLCFN